jgi:predicted DCC family thiol-disulfide oxidoreductase YuxK
MQTPEPVYIVYDGECPFCSRYVKVIRLRDAIGPIALVNAREEHPILQEVRDLGMDLDQGMATKISGRWYFGSECVHILAMLTSSSGFFNRLNAKVFKSPAFTKLIYPVLRTGRNTTLRLLGRSKLRNLD